MAIKQWPSAIAAKTTILDLLITTTRSHSAKTLHLQVSRDSFGYTISA
jgi:hypothetical protein